MAQTSFEQYPTLAVVGLIADTGYRNINSNANGDDENISFGVAVVYTDADGVAVGVPPTDTEVVAGITVAKQKEQNRGLADDVTYQPTDSVSVMTRGRVWVLLEENSTAVSVGDTVYAVPLTGEITAVDTDNLEIPSARFMTSGVAEDLVVVEINLP